MSDTATVTGGIYPTNYSNASGAESSFATLFGSGITYSVVTDSGADTVGGPLVIGTGGNALTVSGANAIDDANSSGGNAITVQTAATVFASQNDTISAASAASTIFGSSAGMTQFSLGGANSSVTGGSGSFVGSSSGANSTLVGGTTASLITVTGANSLAVAGQAGITGINETGATGQEMIATNPLGNSGTLVADLGAGATTVIGGSGTSTINVGSGADAFIFVAGHAGGSEYIFGFSGKDNLGFAGYGYSSSNLPVETVTALGDTLTLTDGTKVTLVGIDHKIFST